MKLKLTRWLIPSLVALFMTLILITPVLAIDPPTSITIDGVWAYRNCRETGDQMYLIAYNITPAVNTTETVTEAYLCRLMEAGVELGVTAPFAYHNDGYNEGVIAIYFAPDDAPTWHGNYTMRLMGNPFLSWNGTIPSYNYTPFDLWQDNDLMTTKVVLSSRIMALAQDLEDAWGDDMATTSDAGDTVLTTYGLGYFVYVVPYLGDVAPYVFPPGTNQGSAIIPPEVPEEWERTDYADSLVTDIIGTPFDLTNMANAFGVSRGALTAILYYGCLIFGLVLVVRKIGSYKPIMMFSIPLVILGAFIGVPLMATILAGLGALAMTAYSIFYKSSTA